MSALLDQRSPANCPDDEDALVRRHVPLVGYLVYEVIGRVPAHVSRDELQSAGLAALAYAARGFDPSRGVPFQRFAATRIRGALLDELRTADWASRSVRAKARRRDAAEEELAGQLGRTPSLSELAGHLDVTVAELDAVHEDVRRATVLSLQGFGDAGAVDDLLPIREPGPDEELLHRERLGYLLGAVAELPPRLGVVIREYFLADRPMQEIAEQLGVTESRISQMRAEALVLLKDGMNAQLDPQLVPAPARPDGCVARRRESYFAAIAAHDDFHTRLAVGATARAG